MRNYYLVLKYVNMNSIIFQRLKQKIYNNTKAYAIYKKHKYIKTQGDSIEPLHVPFNEEGPKLSELSESTWVKMGLNDSAYSLGFPDRSALLQILPEKQNQLPSRKMKDSYSSAIIPLSTDMQLQDTYITRLGFVRNGRLFEDMDVFAVTCAVNHIYYPQLTAGVIPYVVVTVLVDTVDFSSQRLHAQRDIHIKGHVTWVGRSSTEVVVSVEQKDLEDVWHERVRAYFLMAVRDPLNTRAAVINPLIAETEEEKLILQFGEKRRLKREKERERQLPTYFPITTDEEQTLVHKLYSRTTRTAAQRRSHTPKGAQWMEDARIPAVVFCHPQYRNAYHKVFGGFLMRHASEQSWILAHLFCKQTIKLVQMSEVKFIKPVEIGTILQYNSDVVFTTENYIHIHVSISVIDPLKHEPGLDIITNTFSFTYTCDEPVPEIFPKTYQETMQYIQARRSFKEARMHFIVE